MTIENTKDSLNTPNPTIEEVANWFSNYDADNLIPFATLRSIGRKTYGEDWKYYFITYSRDFEQDSRSLEDKNIAIGCISVLTLDGKIGTLTHVLDNADPKKAVKYIQALNDHKKGVKMILSGGRNKISEHMLESFFKEFPQKGYKIVGTEVMGDEFGRVATLVGSKNRVDIARRKKATGEWSQVSISFD